MMSTDYSTINSNYGKPFTPTKKYYPSILAEEAGQLGNGTGGKLGLSEQTSPINQTETNTADPLTLKNTYWEKKMKYGDFNNEKYYELFTNNRINFSTYWLSSRCVDGNSTTAYFDVSFVSSGHVYSMNMYISRDDFDGRNFGFRPVITLNSNVQIDTTKAGDGTTADTAYAIK